MGFYSFQTSRSDQVQVFSVPGSGWLSVAVGPNPLGMFDPSKCRWIDPSKQARAVPVIEPSYVQEVEKELLAIDQSRRQFVAQHNLSRKS